MTTEESYLARIGWMKEPSRVERHELRSVSLLVKRDDLLPALGGGSKVRKLDLLLAAPPFRDAPGWHAVGGIGSGQLVALAVAAAQLGKTLDAHYFWTEPTTPALRNLAAVASSGARIHYHRSRLRLATHEPRLLLGSRIGDRAVIPIGATSTLAMIGFVLAGLELGEQLGPSLRPIDRIYLPLGTGGAATGLAVGLALAGVSATVVAVAVTEAALSSRLRLTRLRRALTERIGAASDCAAPIVIDRRFLGQCYGASTREAVAACEEARHLGLELDPAYGGKAFAAVMADARERATAAPLFWHTGRRALPPPSPSWREHLPPELARALAGSAPRIGRRRFVVGGLAAAAVVARVVSTPPAPAWSGRELDAREGATVLAAAEALFGNTDRAIIDRVDAYVWSLPKDARREVHALLTLVEQAVLARQPFSALAPADRLRALERLASLGDLGFRAARGLRDLCLFGHYASPAAWTALGYEGPWVRR